MDGQRAPPEDSSTARLTLRLAGTPARRGARMREPARRYAVVHSITAGGFTMLRGGLLWLLGIPLPIILILFFLGYLH
jgi:hypothetical protein